MDSVQGSCLVIMEISFVWLLALTADSPSQGIAVWLTVHIGLLILGIVAMLVSLLAGVISDLTYIPIEYSEPCVIEPPATANNVPTPTTKTTYDEKPRSAQSLLELTKPRYEDLL